MSNLINSTGGLFYHARAWRYRQTLWTPFTECIATWLPKWQPKSSRLVIVGPSGGYTLPLTWFKRFDSISAVEPDPMARFIFGKRLSQKVNWDKTDYFSRTPQGFLEERIGQFLETYSNHAILFSNFLGQIKFLGGDDDEPGWRRIKALINQGIRGREFASYHDRFSSEIAPNLEPAATRVSESNLPESEIVKRFYTGQRGELIDHLTGDLFQGLPRQYFSWAIDPSHYHLIEGVYSD